MWRELIAKLPTSSEGERLMVCPPASEADLVDAERQLGHPLPTEQRSLLLESNGVYAPLSHMHLVWPVDQVVRMNLAMRGHGTIDREYLFSLQPMETLLFFGEDGMGNMWCVMPHSGSPAVDGWDHEDDSRTQLASNLAKFLEWWQTQDQVQR
jgi:hypothetical protein